MYIYETKQLDKNDLLEIEKCGKSSLPIYYRFQHLESFKQRTNYHIWGLKDVSNLYGFIIFESKSPFHIHILSIAIYSLYRKKRLASYLMNEVKKKYSGSKITLFVQISNLPALNFYIKHSFKVSKFLPDYYQNLDISGAYEMSY